jgi:hypothetical protein
MSSGGARRRVQKGTAANRIAAKYRLDPANATDSRLSLSKVPGQKAARRVPPFRHGRPRHAARAGAVSARGSATRKSRQGFPRRLSPLRCVCVKVFGVERSRSQPCLSCHGRTASARHRCVASMSGPTIPDARDAVTGDEADQASVAVPSKYNQKRAAMFHLLPFSPKSSGAPLEGCHTPRASVSEGQPITDILLIMIVVAGQDCGSICHDAQNSLATLKLEITLPPAAPIGQLLMSTTQTLSTS